MRNHRLLQPFIIAITFALFAGLAVLIKWPARDPVAKTEALNAYGQLPLSFEAHDDARFVARGAGYSIGLKADEAVMRLRMEGRGSKVEDRRSLSSPPLTQSSILNPQSSILRMKILNADRSARAEALEPLAGKVNYLIGDDPRAWRANVPTYARVHYASVYPGIDLVYYGNQRRLEYDFIVAPGADPGVIRLSFEGAERIDVDERGDLVLHTAAGELRQHKPLIFQEVDGARREIAGQYKLIEPAPSIRDPQSAIRNQQVGFHIGDYDGGRPLVIDPVLSYSTYFGSNGSEDIPAGIAVDAAGQIHLVGTTGAADFPTANPAQGGLKGKSDVFIAKLNAAGNALVYSTYLGGSNEGQGADVGFGIAVDGSGNAYVTGVTSASDFPLRSALENTLGGPADAFVAKLNPSGALVYSTYLGGSGAELGFGIAVDSAGAPYIVGTTSSGDLLSGGGKKFADEGEDGEDAAERAAASPEQTGLRGPSDAFVIKLAPSGTARVYGRYVGGSGSELGLAIAVDAMSNAYITGLTVSNNFPTTNPLQAGYGGGDTDGFVTKLSANGSSFIYSTYLGGSGRENHTFLQQIPFPGVAIAVDAAGAAYVAGTTTSSNFPTRSPAQASFGGVADAYVAKINPAGNALVYSTYLGGTGEELCFGLAVDAAGNAYVVGGTDSTGFPTANPLQAMLNGAADAFVAKLNAAGNTLAYSTYLGGGSEDLAIGVAVDTAGNACVFGLTTSNDYPTIQPFQSSRRGDADTFIARLRDEGGPPQAGTVSSVSAANYLGPQLAPESIAAAFGAGLATRVEVATSLPLPTNLAGTTVTVRDVAGQDRLAQLFFVAPGQINFLVPAGTPTGQATITVTSGAGQVSRGTSQIVATAAGLFSADASGQGLASAVVLRVRASGEQVFEPVARFDQSLNRFVAVPIDFGPESDQLFLILFGTGMRFRTNAAAAIGGTAGAVLYVGPSVFAGLDQCNVNLPRSLAGRGEVNVAMTVDGRAVNMVRVSIR
ncbi:MAG: SBBP repeat-containing protein [Blastocatellia bacterium]